MRIDRSVAAVPGSGDRVYVTGRLGGPGAALRAWLGGGAPAPRIASALRHRVPRLREARWLAARGMHACIDISDGLAADAGHLAAASQRRSRSIWAVCPVSRASRQPKQSRAGRNTSCC